MIVNVEQNIKGGRKEADGSSQKIYGEGDSSLRRLNREKPKLITHHRTYGRGVHRFDMDEVRLHLHRDGGLHQQHLRSGIRNPAKPQVSLVAGPAHAGSEKPTRRGRRNRLHHALRFGDELWRAAGTAASQ
jgi:hypothetical protein